MATSQNQKSVLAGKSGSSNKGAAECHAELTAVESNEIKALLTKGVTIRPIGR